MYNNKNNKEGGKVLASGGFGCVFTPALKCEGSTRRSRENNKISKLMIEKYALQEYEEINKYKKILETVPNYEDYYMLYDISICKPAKLTSTDLQNFKKCTALPKKNITKQNINSSLDKVMTLNMPNGGLPVDDYLYDDGSFQKMYDLHVVLVNLLKNGIVKMNHKNIYHCDIKDANVLVDTSLPNQIKTRLIDWGLSCHYIPFKNNPFPSTWRNRPLQFNVPFSVILFSDAFIEKYTKFLKDNGVVNDNDKDKLTEDLLKPFVLDYVKFWMDERGAGHYKYINEVMFMLFSNDLIDIDEKDKPQEIETQITMVYIVDYIVDVLLHFTKFKADGSLDLRQYLDNVFIEIVDIWGFIMTYVPIIELLSNSYQSLTKIELKIFKQLQFIFVEYLYNPRHEPIDMDTLFSDLKIVGDLLHIKLTGKKVVTPPKSISPKSDTKKHLAKGLNKKTRKNNLANNKKTRVSFRRGPKKRRFKNPYFLSKIK
jgi:serine/threonine protein kinase